MYEGSTIHTLAARELIRDLEENSSVGGSGIANVREEICRLGCTYSLATRHTSFVAVQEKVRRLRKRKKEKEKERKTEILK